MGNGPGAELAKAKRDATLLWLKEQEDAGGVDAAFGVGVEHDFRRLTLLAARRVRIWEMAISFSLRRRSGWGRPWRIRTELRLSSFARVP